MPVIDPISVFGLDIERLGDATYRRIKRNGLLHEIHLSDSDLIEIDGRQIARNEVFDWFNLLDNPGVQDYLRKIHASKPLQRLWVEGSADAVNIAERELDWIDLVAHPVHKQFYDRWQIQWKKALENAFHEPVEPSVFSAIVACCEHDGSLGVVCYEAILRAVDRLQIDAEPLAEALESGEANDEDVDLLLTRSQQWELIGGLPPSCNMAKLKCADALHRLSIQLHNAGRVDEVPIHTLELARAVVGDCAVGQFYDEELQKLRDVRTSKGDWDLVNEFVSRVRHVLEALDRQTDWSEIEGSVERICAEAVEAVGAANRLPEYGEGTAAFRDEMAGMLFALTGAVSQREFGRGFALPLIEAANSVRCNDAIKREIETALTVVRRASQPTLTSTAQATNSDEQQKRRDIRTSKGDWDLVNEFVSRVRHALEALDRQTDWCKIEGSVERICAEAVEAVGAANRLPEYGEGTAAIRDEMAGVLFALTGAVSQREFGRGFALPLIEAANSVRCNDAIKREIETALTVVRRATTMSPRSTRR